MRIAPIGRWAMGRYHDQNARGLGYEVAVYCDCAAPTTNAKVPSRSPSATHSRKPRVAGDRPRSCIECAAGCDLAQAPKR